jgi:hypothetical protein
MVEIGCYGALSATAETPIRICEGSDVKDCDKKLDSESPMMR